MSLDWNGRPDVGSLDDLICPSQQRRRDRQPERLGGLEVDDQVELDQRFNVEIGGSIVVTTETAARST